MTVPASVLASVPVSVPVPVEIADANAFASHGDAAAETPTVVSCLYWFATEPPVPPELLR